MENYRRKVIPKQINMQRQTEPIEHLPQSERDYNLAENSTPYYTPLDYLQTSFEFPAPWPAETPMADTESANLSDASSSSNAAITSKAGSVVDMPESSSSPSVSRKMCRYSVSERRSVGSPMQIIKKTPSLETDVEAPTHAALLDDKENTKPKTDEKGDVERFSAEHNSPAIIEDGGGGVSPKVAIIGNENILIGQNHLTYSPKLLTSLKNIQSGSPLGIISSAVYKNGNYFKFPEIDHVVQDKQGNNADATNKVVSRLHSPKLVEKVEKNASEAASAKGSVKTEALNSHKNRKNKNNLKIQITDLPELEAAIEHSPNQKPKTPTIKNTKEKALSLDSAAVESELTIVVSNINDLCMSCDEINNTSTVANLISHNGQNSSSSQKPSASVSDRSISTSLVHLPSTTHPVVHMTEALSRAYPFRTGRRMPYHHIDAAKKCLDAGSVEVAAFKEDEESSFARQDQLEARSSCKDMSSPFSNSSSAGFSRGSFKHNMLLHTPNANLKTLPETLTLVEFRSKAESFDCNYKQKSMDLPNSAIAIAPIPGSAVLKPNHTISPSSTNLLQRRGSNHSLTLNLHGSCGNLLGSCRTGLSASNYSLGSMDNSGNVNYLNSKSSCNLNLSSTPKSSLPKNTNTSQGVKQSLFSRRGSNNSFTLTSLTANSCGNLNTFSSQNLLTSSNVAASASSVGQMMAVTPKRGLLERRGSNQSLTLNTQSSFGGIGQECHTKNLITVDAVNGEKKSVDLPNVCCAQRKFLSNESLHRANKQFSDLNQAHKRNANQLCFGSVSDLKPTEQTLTSDELSDFQTNRREHFDFQESTVCTCSGVRNIMTRPLSPQTTSEEFKMYLANIQLLQNASNPLNQFDLIKLNYIFDNNVPTNNLGIINQSVYSLHLQEKKEADAIPTPPVTTSEDCDIAARYQQVVDAVLQTMRISEDEQKKIFRDLHKEFWDLPLNHQEKPMVFGTHAKNRYKTILPNENSRVFLEACTHEVPVVDVRAEDDELMQPGKTFTHAAEAPYINANYIKGPDFTSKCYIATQGPLPNTIFEFWLMAYQNICKYIQSVKSSKEDSIERSFHQKIIMLTNFVENNRQKCSVYFPVELNEVFISIARQEAAANIAELSQILQPYLLYNNDDDENNFFLDIKCFELQLNEETSAVLPQHCNFFVIKNIGIVKKNGYSIRKMIVLYAENTRRQQLHIKQFCCYHYWYPDWPDHRSPKDINTLLDICLHILNLGKCEQEFTIFDEVFTAKKTFLESQNPALYSQDLFNALQPLPIIHCSAGIGRTGCLTAILNSVRQLRQSLACSLLSMTNTMTVTPQLISCPEQIFNVVNLSLPTNVAQQLELDHFNLFNDTDSSFTFNTLRFINYVLKSDDNDMKTLEDSHKNTNTTNKNDALSMSQLPTIPDVHVDILGIVCNLRLQRGGMVQNSEQYELIHRAVCSYLKRTLALKRF